MPEPSANSQASDPVLRLEMLSQARFLAAARAMISNAAQRLGFGDMQCGQISLALDEALCNIINHGYGKQPDGRIWISVFELPSDSPSMKIVIEDRARQVDPSSIRSRDLDDVRPGGLGVYIIHEVMDRVLYEQRPEGGMRLTMTKTAANSEPEQQPTTKAATPAPGRDGPGAGRDRGREVKHEQR
jgi:anti-sigma regulatory factor (Ser/Thr protein kinase)